MTNCKQRVANDFGVDFHQCTRKAIEGSEYCRQHHDRKNPQEFVPADPTIGGRGIPEPSKVTVRGGIHWPRGEGPQIKMDYAVKPVFLERLRIEVSSDTQYAYLRGSGPWIKKDGKPAATGTDGTVSLAKLPELTRAKVEAEIELLRGFLP